MPIWDQMVCYGDSLTTGARSSVGYPEDLAKLMRKDTGKAWLCFNEAVNGETVLELLRRMDQKRHLYTDCQMATLMIGTNDTKPTIATPATTAMRHDRRRSAATTAASASGVNA